LKIAKGKKKKGRGRQSGLYYPAKKEKEGSRAAPVVVNISTETATHGVYKIAKLKKKRRKEGGNRQSAHAEKEPIVFTTPRRHRGGSHCRGKERSCFFLKKKRQRCFTSLKRRVQADQETRKEEKKEMGKRIRELTDVRLRRGGEMRNCPPSFSGSPRKTHQEPSRKIRRKKREGKRGRVFSSKQKKKGLPREGLAYPADRDKGTPIQQFEKRREGEKEGDVRVRCGVTGKEKKKRTAPRLAGTKHFSLPEKAVITYRRKRNFLATNAGKESKSRLGVGGKSK